MMAEKKDAEEFRKALKNLRAETWLGARRWWPYFLFHHTDIENVVSILQAGRLFCRSKVELDRILFTDGANSEIIQSTDSEKKDYVRFYFRPRTPMLYNNEGFRPQNIVANAHCPIPIYLLFDFEKIICREDSRFTNKSLAKKDSKILSKASEFRNLPFKLIYHDSAFPSEQRDSIVSSRHAEVIVPQQIGLEHLDRIWCRSQAEYETLQFLLPSHLWQQWGEKITASTEHNLFSREWVYVEEVILSETKIHFRFNPPKRSSNSGPFSVRAEIEEIKTGHKFRYNQSNVQIQKNLSLDLAKLSFPERYYVKLYLDNHIAYANNFDVYDNIPF